MNPLYTNGACLPTTNKAATCSPGFLADYVIMAKTKQHIAAGVKFAREYNLRLVVRNTGHDFINSLRSFGNQYPLFPGYQVHQAVRRTWGLHR